MVLETARKSKGKIHLTVDRVPDTTETSVASNGTIASTNTDMDSTFVPALTQRSFTGLSPDLNQLPETSVTAGMELEVRSVSPSPSSLAPSPLSFSPQNCSPDILNGNYVE